MTIPDNRTLVMGPSYGESAFWVRQSKQRGVMSFQGGHYKSPRMLKSKGNNLCWLLNYLVIKQISNNFSYIQYDDSQLCQFFVLNISKIRIKRFIYNQFEVSFIKMDHNYNQLQKQQQNHNYMDFIIPRGNPQANVPIRDTRVASFDYMDDLQHDLNAYQTHNIKSLHDIEITESCLDVVDNPRTYHNRQELYNSTRYQPPHTIPSINQQALVQGFDMNMHMSQHKSNIYRAENDLDFLQDNLSNLKSNNNRDQISVGSVKDIFQRDRSNSHEYSFERDAKKKFGIGDFVETAHNLANLLQEDNFSNRTPAVRTSQSPFMQNHVNNHYEQHQRRDTRHESRQLDSIQMNYQKHQQQNLRQPTDDFSNRGQDYYSQKSYVNHVIQPEHQAAPEQRQDDQKYGLSIQEIQDLQASKLQDQNPSKRKKFKKCNQNLHQQKTHTLDEIRQMQMTEHRHRSHTPSTKLGGKKEASQASKSTGLDNKDTHRNLGKSQHQQPHMSPDRNDIQQRFQQQLDIKTDEKLVVVEKVQPIKQIEPITQQLIPPPPQKKMSMRLCLDFSDANIVKQEQIIPPVQPVAAVVDKKKPSKIITLDFTKSLPKQPASTASAQIEPVKPIEPLKTMMTGSLNPSLQINAADILPPKGQHQAMSVQNSEKAAESAYQKETQVNNYPNKKKSSPPKLLNKAPKQSSQRNVVIQNLDEDKNFDDQDSTKANLGKQYYQQDPEEANGRNKSKYEAMTQRPNKQSAREIKDISSQEAIKPDSRVNSGITDYSFYNSKKEMKKQQQAQQITQKANHPAEMIKKGNNGPVVSQIKPLTSIFDVTKMQPGTKINMNLDEQNSEKFSRKAQRQTKPTATRTSRFNMENNHQKDNVLQSLPDQVQHLIAGAAQVTKNQGTQQYRAQTVAPQKHQNPQQNYNFQQQQKMQMHSQTQQQQQTSIQQNRGTSQRTPPNVGDVNHQNISIGSYIKQEYIINIHMDQNGQQQQSSQLQPGQQNRQNNNHQQQQHQPQGHKYSDSELQIPLDNSVVTELRAKPAIRKSNNQHQHQQNQQQQQQVTQPAQAVQVKEEQKKFGLPQKFFISPEQFQQMDEDEQQAFIDFLKSQSKNQNQQQQVNKQQQPVVGQKVGNQVNEAPKNNEVVANHQVQAENQQDCTVLSYGAHQDARSDWPDVHSYPYERESDFSQYQQSIQGQSPIKRAVVLPPQQQQKVEQVQQAAPPVDQNKLNEQQKKLIEQQQKIQQNAMVKQQLQEVVQKIDSITRQKAFGARAASSSSNLSNLANGSDSEGLNYYFQDQTSVARQEASDYAHESINQQQQMKNLIHVLPHLQEQIQQQIQNVPTEELQVMAEKLPNTQQKASNRIQDYEADIENVVIGVPSQIQGPIGTIQNFQPERRQTMQGIVVQEVPPSEDQGSPTIGRNKRLQKQSSKASSTIVFEDSPVVSENRSPKKRAKQERLGEDPVLAQDPKTIHLKKIFKIEKERTVNINWEVNRDILTENLSVEPFQSDTDTMRFRTYSYEARGEDQVKAVMYQQSKSKPHDAENKMKEVRLLNQTGVQAQQPNKGSLMVSLQIQEEGKDTKELQPKQENSEATKPESPKKRGKPRKQPKEKPVPAEAKTPKKRGRKPRQQSSTKLPPEGDLPAPVPQTASGQNSRRQTRNMKDEEPKEGGFLVPTPKQSMEINSNVFSMLKQTPPKRKRSRKNAAKEQVMDINQNQEKPPGLGTDKKEINTGKIVPRRRKKAASTKTSEQSYEPRIEKHQMMDEDYDPVAHSGQIQPLFSTERNVPKGKIPERPKTRFAKEQNRFQEHFASSHEQTQGIQSQHFAGMARQGLHDLQQTNNSAAQYQLVQCEKYQSFENQPYRIYFTFEVQMLMCIHAYLSKHEVIGLLGGKCYDSTDMFEGQPIKYIIITKIYQSDSCTNHALRQKNCEISDAQQIRIQDLMDKDKVQKVAWYHSHPIFDVDPSMQDLVTHYQQQVEFDRQGLPFIGVIIGPYYPKQDLDNTLINVFNLKQQSCPKDPNQSRNPRRTVLQNLKEQGRSFHYKTIPKIKIKYSWYYEIKSMIKHNAQLKKDNPNLSGEWAYKKAQKKVYQLLNREAQQPIAEPGVDNLKQEDQALDAEDNSRQIKLRFSRQEKFILSLKKLCEINCELYPKFNLDKQIRDRIMVTENNELSILNSQLRSCEAIALKEAERSPDFDKKFQSNYTLIVKDQTISEYFWVSDEKQIIKTIFKIEQSIIKEFELATKSYMEQLFKQRQIQLNNRKDSLNNLPILTNKDQQVDNKPFAPSINEKCLSVVAQHKLKEDLNSKETDKQPLPLLGLSAKLEHNQEDTMPRNLVINLSPRRKEDHQYSSQDENSAVSMNFAALIENENKVKTQIPAIKPVSAILNPLINNQISQVQEQLSSNLESLQEDFRTKERE